MTVGELLDELKNVDPKLPIVVCIRPGALDDGYSPASGIEIGRYASDNTWCGDFGPAELTKETLYDGYSQTDVPDGPLAIAIYPTF